ncbi:MAG: DUF503 domain-containing protein [bacterium]
MTTFVACVEFLLYCPGSFSLKDKRKFVRSISDRLAEKFNVSVAEVDHQDHQRLIGLAVGAVSSKRRQLESVGSKIENELQKTPGVQLREINMTIH